MKFSRLPTGMRPPGRRTSPAPPAKRRAAPVSVREELRGGLGLTGLPQRIAVLVEPTLAELERVAAAWPRDERLATMQQPEVLEASRALSSLLAGGFIAEILLRGALERLATRVKRAHAHLVNREPLSLPPLRLELDPEVADRLAARRATEGALAWLQRYAPDALDRLRQGTRLFTVGPLGWIGDDVSGRASQVVPSVTGLTWPPWKDYVAPRTARGRNLLHLLVAAVMVHENGHHRFNLAHSDPADIADPMTQVPRALRLEYVNGANARDYVSEAFGLFDELGLFVRGVPRSGAAAAHPFVQETVTELRTQLTAVLAVLGDPRVRRTLTPVGRNLVEEVRTNLGGLGEPKAPPSRR